MDGRNPHAVLGVDECASASEIKRAFRAAVFAAHPDRGGRREDFEAAVAAFEALTSQPPVRRGPAWATATPLDRRARAAARNPFARAASDLAPSSSWSVYDSVRPAPRAARPVVGDFDAILRAELARLAA